MMTTSPLSLPTEDTELVAQSLAGDRGAFGRIVQRYQALVCGLGFSAIGDVSKSEDLAQDTFVTAWKSLRQLREPTKLRSWLCGIARNNINSELRRQGRDPARTGTAVDETAELAAPDLPPAAQAISNEEVALLWRELEKLPEIYREPLVLFYREHQSLAEVATALELSEDTAAQRLSRGRKQLHERMLLFVETALQRTSPTPRFSAKVQAALAPVAIGSQGATLISAKSLLVKGAGGVLAVCSFLAGSLLGLFAAIGLNWSGIRNAPTTHARRFQIRWTILLWSAIAAMMTSLVVVSSMAHNQGWDLRREVTAETAVWVGYLMALSALLAILFVNTAENRRRNAVAGVRENPMPAKTLYLVTIGVYTASSAWLLGFMWLLGDHVAAGMLWLGTIGWVAWNLHRVRREPRDVADHLNLQFHGWYCVILLLVANLRLDRWLAPIFRTNLNEMQRALPMMTVHLLTLGLVVWVGVVTAVARSAARRQTLP